MPNRQNQSRNSLENFNNFETRNKRGNLLHVDQAQSSTPGISLTYSGRNKRRRICVARLSSDVISKKLFIGLQHITCGEETLQSKRSMGKDAKSAGVQIKQFNSDNEIFTYAEFWADLTNNSQRVHLFMVCAN